MSNDLLTLKEIARRLEVPESNIRYYRDKFSKYIPSVGEGRKMRYKPKAVEVFDYIARSMKDGKTSSEIDGEIGAMFPINAELQTPEVETETTFHQPQPEPQVQSQTQTSAPTLSDEMFTTFLDRQSRTFDRIADTIGRQNVQDNHILELKGEIRDLKKAIVLMWEQKKLAIQHEPTPDSPEQDNRLKLLESENQDLKNRIRILEHEMSRIRR